jgi:hypothetical protein
MIDWIKVKYFNPDVDYFPESPDEFADPELIYSLDDFRGITGSPLYPSPVDGALARFDGSITGRHYAVGRKSDAIDVFTDGSPAYVFIKAISCGLWGGVGVYLDTKYRNRPSVMFHLDKRPLINGQPTIWFRDNYKYFYLRNNPKNAIELIKKLANYD